MGRFLTIMIFIISIVCLCCGIKWLFDGDLFFGIFNTVLGVFNTYHFGKYVFER